MHMYTYLFLNTHTYCIDAYVSYARSYACSLRQACETLAAQCGVSCELLSLAVWHGETVQFLEGKPGIICN